ncbi:glycosyltransferase [Nocardioides carbamazepini]|uniref:glycosyltransferase n=1 Tax=Nocardioides carbamazepini TaxID=2854259 RepID=UPI00214A4170|nr:glycosyltransferase [Nocardioides carbamazepini]MCR1782001.1 glycosyltransferase [Nocardioides carbamazepini]
MRILTVIAELGVGGAETIAVALASAAAADGHEVWVASGPGHRIPALEAAGVRHVPVPLVGRGPAGLARSLRRLRSLPPPDLVHAHNPKASLVAGLALGGRAPVLTTLHGVAGHDSRRAARILRRVSDRVVVVSPHLGEALAGEGYPGSRIDVVPTALEPLPAYPRGRARAELGLPPDVPVGLCLARMVPQKRHDLLVEAWPVVADRALLLLAGDGPRRGRVLADIDRHGVGASVHPLGERADVPRLLAASDFLVLPTDWEGLPVAVLEALAAGLPVLASGVSGLVEHFGGAVRFVAPGSVAALAAGLVDLVDQEGLRAELARRGRARVTSRFSVARMVAHYDDIYLRLAGRPGDRRMGTGVTR